MYLCKKLLHVLILVKEKMDFPSFSLTWGIFRSSKSQTGEVFWRLKTRLDMLVSSVGRAQSDGNCLDRLQTIQNTTLRLLYRCVLDFLLNISTSVYFFLSWYCSPLYCFSRFFSDPLWWNQFPSENNVIASVKKSFKLLKCPCTEPHVISSIFFLVCV